MSKNKKNLGLKVAVKYVSKNSIFSMSLEHKTKRAKRPSFKRKPTLTFDWRAFLGKFVEKALWQLSLESFKLIIDLLHNIFYTNYPLGKKPFYQEDFFWKV